MKCKHEQFYCNCTVNRMEDIERFNMEVTVHCEQCMTKFQFLGLPVGLNLNGASVSPDGLEGRFGILPIGETPSPIEGSTGFSISFNKKESLDGK